MSAPRGRRRPKAAGRRSAAASPFGVPWWALGLVGVVVLGVGWAVLRLKEEATGSGGIPGPIGGSSIAQDVKTLVGKPAPAFTLPDSEGNNYAVSPGHGVPLVLISHMGIT